MNQQIGLGRSFDPSKYSSHKITVLISLLVFLSISGIQLLQEVNLLQSLTLGFNASIAAFVAWVLAREWDPQRNLIAHISQISIAVFAYFFGPLEILLSATFIFFSRFLSKITGLKIARWEVWFAFFSILFSAYWTQYSLILLFMGLVFLIDSGLKEAFIDSRVLAFLSTTLFIIFATLIGPPIAFVTNFPFTLWALLIVGINLISTFRYSAEVRISNDKLQAINLTRFRRSLQLPFFLIGLSIFIFPDGVVVFLPALTVLIARLIPNSWIRPELA